MGSRAGAAAFAAYCIVATGCGPSRSVNGQSGGQSTGDASSDSTSGAGPGSGETGGGEVPRLNAVSVAEMHGHSAGLRLGSWLLPGSVGGPVAVAADTGTKVFGINEFPEGTSSLGAALDNGSVSVADLEFDGLFDVGDVDGDGQHDVAVFFVGDDADDGAIAILGSSSVDFGPGLSLSESLMPIVGGSADDRVEGQGLATRYETNFGLSDLNDDGLGEMLVWRHRPSIGHGFAIVPGGLQPGRYALGDIELASAASATIGLLAGPAGDFDGDGRDDVALFEGRGLASLPFAEELRVLDPIGASILDETFTLEGYPFAVGARSSVDFNGDGMDELLIGQFGISLLVAGGTSLRHHCLPDMEIRYPPPSLESIQPRFGWALTPIPDVTGDGLPEIVVTAPNTDDELRPNDGRAGALFVISGAATGNRLGYAGCSGQIESSDLEDLVQDGLAIEVAAPHASHDFGYRVAVAGGGLPPGEAHVVVSAPSASKDVDEGGALYLFSISAD